MAQWLSWLERRPVTAKVVGSSPIWVVKGLFNPCGVLAQLGEHLPYKQRVIGSSPIGPIFMSGILKSSLCVCIEAIFFCDNFQILFRTADIDLILANIVPEVCLLIG